VADDPETTGTGTDPGHDSDSDVPSAEITASGPERPSENSTLSPGTAAGASIPAGSFARAVETVTHDLPRWTRTGNTFSVYLTLPSGSAVVVDVAVVSAATVTGFPDALACFEAAVTAASSACCDALPSTFICASGPLLPSDVDASAGGASPVRLSPVVPDGAGVPGIGDAPARGNPTANSPTTANSTTASLRTRRTNTSAPN
jgi:hypothetical protein